MSPETSKSIHQMAAMWEAVDRARSAGGVAPTLLPEGAFTVRDYAERYNLPLRTARDHIDRMVQRGVLETGRHYAITHGICRAVTHYRPKEGTCSSEGGGKPTTRHGRKP